MAGKRQDINTSDQTAAAATRTKRLLPVALILLFLLAWCGRLYPVMVATEDYLVFDLAHPLSHLASGGWGSEHVGE